MTKPRESIFSNWLYRDEDAISSEAVIFDIDGVLADASARQHFVRGSQPDWEGFFNACNDDPLIDEVAELLKVIDGKFSVVLLTGRPLSVQEKTRNWIEHHGIRWDLLIMRNSGDYAAARNFKRGEIVKLRSQGMTLRLGFEDDARNVEMFTEEKVPCVYLHSGYY